MIWYELPTDQFCEAGLTELRTAQHVYENKDILVICYLDDWYLVLKSSVQCRKIQKRLEEQVYIEGVGELKHFPEI